MKMDRGQRTRLRQGYGGQAEDGGRRRGFTLIELLVVTAIIGLLLALTLPAFEAFTRRSLTTCIPELASTLRLSRQYAITHHQNVFVVFPDNEAQTKPLDGDEVDKALRGYAVISTNNATGLLYYVTEWKYLPRGVYFVGDPAFMGGSTVFSSYSAGSATRFPFPGDSGPKQLIMPTILFKPNGRAYSYTGAAWSDFSVTQIGLMEGTADLNTNLGTVVISQTATNNVRIRVRNKTGQLDFVGI